MRRLFLVLAIFSFLSAPAFAADDQPIKDRMDAFKAAWEKDDASAMAAMWADDGTLINPFGVVGHNRAEVENIFVQEHSGPFKNTKYEVSSMTVQWVTPDVALVDISAKITGVHGPDGAAAPDYPHHVVWVLVMKDGKWMTAAARPYQFSTNPNETK